MLKCSWLVSEMFCLNFVLCSMLCCVERSYRSAVSQINDMRHQKALLQAHCELAKETVMRTEEFTQQIQHQHEMLTELHRYDES